MGKIIDSVTNYLGLAVFLGVVSLAGVAYFQHKRIANLESANVTLSADVSALKVKQAGVAKVNKEQGAKHDELSKAAAAEPVWSGTHVPDAVARQLRAHADAKSGAATGLPDNVP